MSSRFRFKGRCGHYELSHVNHSRPCRFVEHAFKLRVTRPLILAFFIQGPGGIAECIARGSGAVERPSAATTGSGRLIRKSGHIAGGWNFRGFTRHESDHNLRQYRRQSDSTGFRVGFCFYCGLHGAVGGHSTRHLPGPVAGGRHERAFRYGWHSGQFVGLRGGQTIGFLGLSAARA
jgi:hypothetical protein